MLSFQLASRLALHRGRLPPEQLRFLLQGGAGAGGPGGSQGGAAPGGGAAAGCPAEIPPRVWAELQALAALPVGARRKLVGLRSHRLKGRTWDTKRHVYT